MTRGILPSTGAGGGGGSFTGYIPKAIIDSNNTTTTPLGTQGVYTGEWTAWGESAGAIQISVATDVGGLDALTIEISTDGGTTIDRRVNVDITSFTAGEGGDEVTIPRKGTHYRVMYTNPNGPQTFLRLTTQQLGWHAEKRVPLIDSLSENSSALITKGIIEGRSSAGGGTYVDVKVAPSGAMEVNCTDNEDGIWGYAAGTSGTVVIVGRVLQITAVALGSAGSIQINGGNTIPLPYDTITQASSSLTIEPKGNLVDPSVTFTGTDSYLIEFVS